MKKAITLILLLLASKTTIAASHLTETANDYCSKDSLKDPNLSNTERKDLRESRETPWYNEYKDIINFLKDPENNSEDWFEIGRWESIILIIFMIVVFICFIVFIVACFKFKSKTINVKPCTVIGCVCLWIFFILFIVSLIFFSAAEHLTEDFMCSVFKMPSGALDGINDTENKFIGLNNLKDTYKVFSEELSNLTGVQNNLNSIIQQNHQSQSNDVWLKSIKFYNTHKESQITDAEGVYLKPTSVQILQEGINTEIASELTELDLVSDKINTASLVGKELSVASNSEGVKLSLSSLQNNLDSFIKAIEDFGDRSSGNYKSSSKYARYGYWFMIVFGIIAVVLFFVVFFIMCRMCFSNKCWNCLKCGKGLVVVLSLMLLVYLIMLFNMFVGITSLSGICGFLAKFEENSKTAMDEFPEINSDVRKFVEICMTSNATGNLKKLINANFVQENHLKKVDSLLDGLSSYRKWKNTTTSSSSSSAIERQKINWDAHEIGFITDYPNVNEKLEELNDLISCSDDKYEITKEKCEKDDTNCKSVYQSGTKTPISVPACVEKKTEATKIYNNLQQYQDQEIGLMNRMQKMVSETTNPESVQSKFKLAKTSLTNSNDDVVLVENSLNGSLKFTREYNAHWREMEDCRALRIGLLQFEEIGCFRVNYYYYVFYSVSWICALIWFFMLWFACCAFRSSGENEEPREEKAPKPKEEDLDVDDKEKVPFY